MYYVKAPRQFLFLFFNWFTSLKPGQKITRVGGNQAGISCLVGTLFLLPTSLFPFFSYHSEKRIEKHLPPTQTNHSFVGGGWQFQHPLLAAAAKPDPINAAPEMVYEECYRLDSRKTAGRPHVGCRTIWDDHWSTSNRPVRPASVFCLPRSALPWTDSRQPS